MAKRILVAENDKFNMRLFHDILTHRGYETVEIGNGLAALDSARAAPPDLIVTGMNLPGLSGLELTGRLKADPALARVPVIAVSAFVGKAEEARIRAAGVDDFVGKPVAPSRLLAAVERNLARTANGNGHVNGNGRGHVNGDVDVAVVVEEEPAAKPWTIVADFAALQPGPKPPEPEVPKPAEPKPEMPPPPPPKPEIPPAPPEPKAEIPPPSRIRREIAAQARVPFLSEPELEIPPPPFSPEAEPPRTIEAGSREAAANALLATALSFTGAFLALALSPAAGGLEGFAELYVVHFPLSTNGLSPGRPVAWQGQQIGRIVRVELDPEVPRGVRVIVQLDSKPAGFEDATATIRHEAIIGEPYIELRPATATSARLEPRGTRAVSALRPLRTEVERDIESLPLWFERAAGMMQGASGMLDRRDTSALGRAVRRIAPLMKAIGVGAKGLDANARETWVEDVSQLLAESRDLIGLLRQIAEKRTSP